MITYYFFTYYYYSKEFNNPLICFSLFNLKKMHLNFHTSILNLKIMWFKELDSIIRVLVSMDCKLTFSTCFKNSKMRIRISTIGHSPLIITCKSTMRSSDEVDSETCEVRTMSLSFEELVSSSLASLAGKRCASKSWFFLLSSSTWAFKELKYSLVVASSDALSFY